MTRKNKAFTLIELLVVIVIIGILSGIGISQFKSYQSKARDITRIQQFTQTVNLLKQYVTANAKLPTLTSTPPSGCGGWRVSNKIHTEKIIEFEADHNYDFVENYWEGCVGFTFYVYPAGHGGCPVSKGPFLVLKTAIESISSGEKDLEDFGLSNYKFHCSSRNWSNENMHGLTTTVKNGVPVFGIFENGDSGPQ